MNTEKQFYIVDSEGNNVPFQFNVDGSISLYGKWNEMHHSAFNVTISNTVNSNTANFIAQPSIIQSAFQLDNGKKIIVYTSNQGITSFECDDKWETFKQPFASCPKEFMGNSPTEYHLNIRKLHGEDKLVKKYSTDINWV